MAVFKKNPYKRGKIPFQISFPIRFKNWPLILFKLKKSSFLKRKRISRKRIFCHTGWISFCSKHCQKFLAKVNFMMEWDWKPKTTNLIFETSYCIWCGYIISLNFVLKKQPTIMEFLNFFGIHFMQGWRATTRHRVQRKWSTKRLKHTWNLFRMNLHLKGVC